MSTGGIVLVALAIAIGLAGIIVPILPGGLLVFGAIAVWAIDRTHHRELGDARYRGGPVRRGGGDQVHLAGETDARGRGRHPEA